MANMRLKNYRKLGYLCHLIFTGIVCVVLAMHIHLLMIDARGEVFGAGMFLLVMWLGLPILALLGAVIIYTYKARTDWKIILLTVAMVAMILQWLIAMKPVMMISIMLESVYVVLTLAIGLRSYLEIRKEQTN